MLKDFAKEVRDAFKELFIEEWNNAVNAAKEACDTFIESLNKYATVINYSLLTIGTGYLMYKYRSSIYSSIEPMVYTKEGRINNRMVEWSHSDKGVEDFKKFCQALIAEISTGSDLSSEMASCLIAFLEKKQRIVRSSYHYF
jgi:hypothetical protein